MLVVELPLEWFGRTLDVSADVPIADRTRVGFAAVFAPRPDGALRVPLCLVGRSVRYLEVPPRVLEAIASHDGAPGDRIGFRVGRGRDATLVFDPAARAVRASVERRVIAARVGPRRRAADKKVSALGTVGAVRVRP